MFILVSIVMIYILEVWKRADGSADDEIYEIMEFFEQEPQPPKCKVALALLMRRPIDLPLWFQHHRKLGISHFYIRLEDSPGWEDYLAAQKDVDYELSSSDKAGNNYETLMHRQLTYVNKCLKKAKESGIDWVFHIDCDELLHGSLAYLDTLDKKYKVVRIPNAEAVFTGDEESCFSAKKFLKCYENAPCKSYVNGKSGARTEDGVDLQGPHHFGYHGEIVGASVYETPFNTLHVLHFDACSFGSWAEKFHHLGNKKQDNIPFPYYNESMDAAVQAYDIYKKHKMDAIKDISADLVYQRA